jgi:hypothetical protein
VTVHEQQDVLAAIAEIFGDGHGGVGGIPAHQRRGVGCGDDDDGAGETGGAEFVFQEFAHFAAAFADKGKYRDIAVGMAGEHGQQGGFADARAGEQADVLTLAAGDEAVQRTHPEIDAGAEAGAGGGRRGCAAHRQRMVAGAERAAIVERAAERIDHAADPGIRYGEPVAGAVGLPGHACRAAWSQAVAARECHGAGTAFVKRDDFSGDQAAIAHAKCDAVADGEMFRQPGQFDRQSGRGDDAPFHDIG